MINQTATASTVPGELNSPRAKLVFLYLSTHEGATIEELGERLGMKKITLYSILKTLRKQGFVEQETDRYVLAASSRQA
jgi:DNA-binding IclR family transcriptional regulator